MVCQKNRTGNDLRSYNRDLFMREMAMSTTEDTILIGVSRLRNLIHREMEKHFRKFGLTSAQFSVLEALYSKGELNVGEIQEYILGTPGNVPVIINNLVKSGYAAKKQSEKDRRISEISLTDEGMKLVKSIYPHPHQEWLEDIMSGLSKDEREELASVLRKCCRKIKPKGNEEDKGGSA